MVAQQGPLPLQVTGEGIPGTELYPACFLREFLSVRGVVPVTLSTYPDGLPMLRVEFDASLKQLLHFCGYDTIAFKSHSFRIGAAIAAASRGDSDAQILAAGRWTSDAFKKYIRFS